MPATPAAAPGSRTPCYALGLAEPLVVDLLVLKITLAGSARVFQRRNRNRRDTRAQLTLGEPGKPRQVQTDSFCVSLGAGTASARSWHGLWFAQPEVSCGRFMYHLVNSVQWSAPSKRTTRQLKYSCCRERSRPK
jgi:hypothetical protein